MSKSYHPEKVKELDIKIGTKEEAYWSGVIRNVEQLIANLEKELKFNKAVLEMAKQKEAAEKDFKH